MFQLYTEFLSFDIHFYVDSNHPSDIFAHSSTPTQSNPVCPMGTGADIKNIV